MLRESRVSIHKQLDAQEEFERELQLYLAAVRRYRLAQERLRYESDDAAIVAILHAAEDRIVYAACLPGQGTAHVHRMTAAEEQEVLARVVPIVDADPVRPEYE